MRKILLLVVCAYLLCTYLQAQTPGMIIKSAGAGASILDPNGDGYVSQEIDGVQIGFTNPPISDVEQSEIPYVPIFTTDISADVEKGPSCKFTDLVGDYAANLPAVLMYWDTANSAVLFRLRIAAYSPNSKGYSVLIDTDQSFGFSGATSDPNALPGNPGFEIEVALMTNHAVGVYDVDGTTSPQLVVQRSYDDYAQKSIAGSNFCSQANAFYDFYVPVSDLASFGVDESSPLRFAVMTNMSPSPSIGKKSISDIGGIPEGNTIDEKLINVIESQTPTPAEEINDGIEERSICPEINSVFVSSTAISGTTTEADSTIIEVVLYDLDHTTTLGSDTCIAMSGTWSLNIADLSPAVSLENGQLVRASATAPGKGQSDDRCDEEVVGICENTTEAPEDDDIDIVGGDKGYEITVNRAVGTKVYLYNSDGSLFNTALLKGGISNPYTTTSNPETVKFECQTGHCFTRSAGSSVYLISFEEPGACESEEYISCHYTEEVSATPTITTSPITEDSVSISGTGTSADAQILVYINGRKDTALTVDPSSPYGFTTPLSNLEIGDTIEIKQIETSKCISSPTTVVVSRTAYSPEFITEECNDSYDLTSVSGTSVEAEGSEITVYDLSSGRTSLGTTIVQANGSWTLSGISISAGDQITAAVTDGLYLSTSSDADTLVFYERYDLTPYTISLAPITEGQTTITGTILGLTSPITIHLYVDSVPLVTKEISLDGSWELIGLNSFDFPTAAEITVRVSDADNCESEESGTLATVQCSNPAVVTISASEQSYCDGNYGQIVVHNSQEGVLYEPVLATERSTFGYSKMGNGGDLTLITYQITDTVNVSVRASKLPVGDCELIVASGIVFSPHTLPGTPIANPIQYFCETGTLADMVVDLPASSSVKWYDAYTGGAELPLSTALDSGVTYYAEAICDTTYCVSLNRIGITANEGLPPAPTGDSAQIVCYESTFADIDMNPGGPGTVVWYSSEDSETPLPMDTELQDGVIYYAEVIHNTCSSETRTSVLITLGMVPDTTLWIGLGDNADWNNADNWNLKVPAVCSNVVIPDVGNGVQYPVISSSAACKSITFEPGGGVLGLQYLTYEKAYVQLSLQRNKWYTLTSPLKSQFSGDYYFEGAPRSYMMLFDEVNPDKLGDGVVVGNWTSPFANIMVPLTPGMGFGFWVDSVEFDFPNPIIVNTNDKMVYFPRESAPDVLLNTVTPYSGLTGKLYPTIAKTLPRDASVAYRFAMENAEGVLEDVRVNIKPGLNLIGNPLMTHLDFDALYLSNEDKISNKVKFWNGTTFVTYMSGSEISSDMNLDYTKIPPMQAFFVEGKPFIGEDTQLDINLAEHFVADTVTKLRAAKVLPKQLLQVKASINDLGSSTVVARRSAATNGYDDQDAFKLFTQYKEVPEVYTIADFRSLDINQFSNLPYMVPLGVQSSSVGFVLLEFINAQSFEGIDVTLLNTMTGEQQNLKMNNAYTLYNDGVLSDGSLFIEFREANTTTEIDENNMCSGRCVSVYAENGTVYATSPPDEKILRFTLWEERGTQICSVKDLNTNEYQVKVNVESQICVARVQTESRTYVVKVFVR